MWDVYAWGLRCLRGTGVGRNRDLMVAEMVEDGREFGDLCSCVMVGGVSA